MSQNGRFLSVLQAMMQIRLQQLSERVWSGWAMPLHDYNTTETKTESEKPVIDVTPEVSVAKRVDDEFYQKKLLEFAETIHGASVDKFAIALVSSFFKQWRVDWEDGRMSDECFYNGVEACKSLKEERTDGPGRTLGNALPEN